MTNDDLFPEEDGSTPLTAEEKKELIVKDAFTRGQLNELEARNIAHALIWAEADSWLKKNLLSVSGIKHLHKEMFKEVWRWAGDFRTSMKNVGNIEVKHVQSEVHQIATNTELAVKQKTYPLNEIAVRLHHRLLWIHPFPNGNGRHARAMADLLLQFNGDAPLTWGKSLSSDRKKQRDKYLEAVRKADKQDFEDLVKFATL